MSLKYRISYDKNDPRFIIFNKQRLQPVTGAEGFDNAVYENDSVLKQRRTANNNGTRDPATNNGTRDPATNNGTRDPATNNGTRDPASVKIRITNEDDSDEDYENVSKPVSDVKNASTENPWEEVYFESQEEETKWLSWIETQLKKFAGTDGDNTEISLQQFKDAFGLKQCFFAERFFRLCDSNHSGTTSIYNLISSLVKVTKGTALQKLKFLFDVYDVNGDGYLDIDELIIVLRSCMVESSVKLSEDDLENLTAVLFESADTDNTGKILFEDFKRELEKHPGVIENLTISCAQWLKPDSGTKKKKPVCSCPKHFTKTYLENNLRKVLFYIWYLLVNLILAGYAAYLYRESNGFIIAARVCGLPLNFNCMMILVLMLRKSLTYLRLTFLNQFLPLDHNILFHKRVGLVIGFLSIIHTGAHIGNAVVLSEDGVLKVWEILLTEKAEFGTIAGSAMITGWMLDIILIIMIVCSMPFLRRSGHFEVFYWTHILYIAFWILLIFHGPNFWKWFIAPGIIFLGEKISRSKWIKQARYGKTYIEEVTLLSSSVTHLEISRPPNFAYQPGDYLFIQIPSVSRHEWHPFTISSAPELSGRLWLHVRSAGNWTKSLYKYFDQYDPGEQYDIESTELLSTMSRLDIRLRSTVRRTTIKQGSKKLSQKRKTQRPRSRNILDDATDPKEAAKQRRLALRNKIVKVQCYIDGPYGTATREIFTTEHAVLVGAGIGVTPMASILQSIMYKYKDSRRKCPKCTFEWLGDFTTDAMKLKKVDFIWINRDQKAFEWFISLLTALEVEQSMGNEDHHEEKIITMHMYMTAAVKKTDMKGIGLQIALDLMHEKSERDLITGLKVRTQPGRPDWNKVFKEISSRKKGKVKVFFCGAPQLGKTIKETSEKYSFDFAKENF